VKRVVILFVAVHLLIDLAIPSLPGAFRFNPDESAVGLRMQTVQTQDPAPSPQVRSLWMTAELPRLERKTSAGLRREVKAPDLLAFLPRRDPSPNQSRKGSGEDH